MEQGNKKILGILAAMGMMGGMSGGSPTSHLNRDNVRLNTKRPPVPRGCKRYFYNEDGICSDGVHTIYFDAMTERKAGEKYERWKQNQIK